MVSLPEFSEQLSELRKTADDLRLHAITSGHFHNPAFRSLLKKLDNETELLIEQLDEMQRDWTRLVECAKYFADASDGLRNSINRALEPFSDDTIYEFMLLEIEELAGKE